MEAPIVDDLGTENSMCHVVSQCGWARNVKNDVRFPAGQHALKP